MAGTDPEVEDAYSDLRAVPVHPCRTGARISL